MTGRAKRWVLNTATGVLHDRKHLTESCNTDDIGRRFYFASRDQSEATGHLAYRRRCKHCLSKGPVVIPNPMDAEPEPDAAPA